jgi:hypothetical protein
MELASTDDDATGTHSAFFYGTLMAAPILYRVILGTSAAGAAQRARLTMQPACLEGFCRHKVRFCDYPGIVRREGHSVRGMYVAGLTERDVERLDFFEGDDYARERVVVRVLGGKKGKGKVGEGSRVGSGELCGEEVVTETYVYLCRDDLVEEEWNFDEFVREKMWRWADASEEYTGK